MADITVNNKFEIFHKLGTSEQGQCLYEVQDKQTKEYKKYIVPKENADKFEKLNNEISESFSGFDAQSFIKQGRMAGIAGAGWGTALALLVTKKSSALKTFAIALSGALFGGMSGMLASMTGILNKGLDFGQKVKELGVRPYNETTDKNISFTGIYNISSANKKEIKELTNIFYNSLVQEMTPNKKSLNTLDRINKFFVMFPYRFLAAKSDSITEIVKKDGNIIGGYSMINYYDQTAHLNFLTLAPGYKNTKSGFIALLDMGRRICENAEQNGIKYLKFSTNNNNKSVNKILERLPVISEGTIKNETMYKLNIQDFKKTLGME